ncbi:MAG: hypothetical protein PUP91_24120 [Rhizonema sp. PD37]|nr:hypothetical protein [Rhizonema sp. PD37]
MEKLDVDKKKSYASMTLQNLKASTSAVKNFSHSAAKPVLSTAYMLLSILSLLRSTNFKNYKLLCYYDVTKEVIKKQLPCPENTLLT